MSDACNLVLIFKRDELNKFSEVLKDQTCEGIFWNEESGDENEMIVTIYEANYGWDTELTKLSKDGLTFYGNHSAGGDYGPFVFAGHNNEYQAVLSTQEGYPVVIIGEDLQVGRIEFNEVKIYWEIYKKAKEYIEKENITSVYGKS